MSASTFRKWVCAATAACVWAAAANLAYAGGGHGGGGHGGGWHGGGHVHGSVGIYVGPYWGFGYGYPYGWGYPYAWGYPYYAGYPDYPYDGYYAPDAAYPPATSVPYVEPSAQPAAPVYWYYCTAPAGYYPYVNTCSKSWMRVSPDDVPAAPNPAPHPAPSGNLG